MKTDTHQTACIRTKIYVWTQSGEVLEYYQSLKLIRAKSGQNLVTKSCEPTREFDINERIASFPTIYDALWFYQVHSLELAKIH